MKLHNQAYEISSSTSAALEPIPSSSMGKSQEAWSLVGDNINSRPRTSQELINEAPDYESALHAYYKTDFQGNLSEDLNYISLIGERFQNTIGQSEANVLEWVTSISAHDVIEAMKKDDAHVSPIQAAVSIARAFDTVRGPELRNYLLASLETTADKLDTEVLHDDGSTEVKDHVFGGATKQAIVDFKNSPKQNKTFGEFLHKDSIKAEQKSELEAEVVHSKEVNDSKKNEARVTHVEEMRTGMIPELSAKNLGEKAPASRARRLASQVLSQP